MCDIIFNHVSWLNVIIKTYRLKPIWLIEISDRDYCFVDDLKSFNGNGKLVLNFIVSGIKKSKLSSLPFTDYVQVNSDLSYDIINFLRNNTRFNLIEIRNYIANDIFKKKQVGYKHYLILNRSLDEIFGGFKLTQVQQPIKKSIREGLRYEVTNDYNHIEDFYNLHCKTRQRLGLPVQPKKFFYYLWNEIIRVGLGYVVLVHYKNKPISGGIFIGIKNRVFYKFSASDYFYLNLRPNNLMLWVAIQEAKKRGFEIFDFGRTELENEGLRKFKLGWGTIEEPLYYSYYPEVPNNSKFNWLKNQIVSPIIKNSPNFVCRLTGELFYKYFG